MTDFRAFFDRACADASNTEVGGLAEAAGYHVAHTGGGCLVWEKVLPDNSYLWICDEANGLGTNNDHPFLVGFYDGDGNQIGAMGEMLPSFDSALQWCEEIARR
jgi:hypothetical protein